MKQCSDFCHGTELITSSIGKVQIDNINLLNDFESYTNISEIVRFPFRLTLFLFLEVCFLLAFVFFFFLCFFLTTFRFCVRRPRLGAFLLRLQTGLESFTRLAAFIIYGRPEMPCTLSLRLSPLTALFDILLIASLPR